MPPKKGAKAAATKKGANKGRESLIL